MPSKLTEEDRLRLWMYFQDRADKSKEAMFQSLTWIVGFAAALLGFIFVILTGYDAARAELPLSVVVSLAAAAGLVICLYAWFMLSESAKHIEGNWDRAGLCSKNLEGLATLIHAERGKTKPMKIWNQLRIIVLLFGIAFAAIIVWRLM